MTRKTAKALFLSFLISFSTLQAAELCSRTQMIMGTFATITIECTQRAKSEEGFKVLKEVEHSLSSYNKEALVYQLNHQSIITLDKYLSSALSISQEVYRQSEGYFDITIGSVTKKLYHFGEEESVPSRDALDHAKMDINALRIDDKQRARLKKGMTLDLGGMGKGFGVDRAYALLWRAGLREGSVALSGDIRVFSPTKIEIQDPFSEGTVYSFWTKDGDMGVSTSGNYRRYVKDKNHNHLINPKTKNSQKVFASITLVSHLDSAYLDAYATAAAVMPYEKAIEFLDKLDLGYLLILNDKSVVLSPHLEDYCSQIRAYQ